VKINSETNRKFGISSLVENRGYAMAVAFTLIFVSSLLISYYYFSTLPPEGYTTIYLLEYQQKKAIDYPGLLVLNENSTFNVWVVVENKMDTTQSFEVKQKVIRDVIPSFPVETDAGSNYAQTIKNGEAWETLATVSINDLGSYSVVFELWIHDETGTLEFSHNYCVLNVEVVEIV